LTLVLAVGALAIRLLVPAGYMPDVKHLGIVICTGHGPIATTLAISHDKSTPSDTGDKPDQPCGFGGALTGALPFIDSVILAAAIAFIVALGRITGDAPLARSRAWLRPPLRGPPAFGTT